MKNPDTAVKNFAFYIKYLNASALMLNIWHSINAKGKTNENARKKKNR